MGIDIVGLESILVSGKYMNKRNQLLTLGRQQIFMNPNMFTQILKNYSAGNSDRTYNNNDYCEQFFIDLGFQSVDTMDNSSYEGASIIHNLNHPLPADHKLYDYIFDGGTTEHIFNMPQVYENIVDLLDIGGVLCTVVPNNNFSGHGMYQYSPEFFLSVLNKKYGMELIELYIGKKDTGKPSWLNVQNPSRGHNGRNCARFFDNEEVYVISIARKVSNERASLITDPPNQYSYEMIDWA